MEILRALALFVALGLVPGAASAASFSFDCITNKHASNCATAETQLRMDVNSIAGDQVEFIFTNTGLEVSTIAAIYFDDGVLAELATIVDNPPAVDFDQIFPGKSNLPGGKLASPPFVATKEFSAGSVSPAHASGVDPGESVGLIFDLMPGKTFADLLNDLALGNLRVGVHVIKFRHGGNESLINASVPEPPALLLLGIALGAAAFVRRRPQP